MTNTLDLAFLSAVYSQFSAHMDGKVSRAPGYKPSPFLLSFSLPLFLSLVHNYARMTMFKIFKPIFFVAGLCSLFRNKLYSAEILQIKQKGIVFCMNPNCTNNSFKAILGPL